MFIDVLGTRYEIELRDENDPVFKKCGGFRDAFAKKIVVADFKPTDDLMETANLPDAIRLNIRHEIVHAFMYESGLFVNSEHYDGAWAQNEEMIDWFAIQGPKIHQAWVQANAI